MLPEPQSAPPISEVQAEKITSMMMKRQMTLSLRVASIFILLLFGLPLVNAYAPEVANHQVFGFTLTWLILGVLVYPVTVLLSVYFVKSSDRIEAEAHSEIVRRATGSSDKSSSDNNNGGRP
jgi:uncharacterized membrane protein (DUF485 family)